jgi:microcystin-dependent protein
MIRLQYDDVAPKVSIGRESDYVDLCTTPNSESVGLRISKQTGKMRIFSSSEIAFDTPLHISSNKIVGTTIQAGSITSGSITSDSSTFGTANVSILTCTTGTFNTLISDVIKSTTSLNANDLEINNNFTAYNASIRTKLIVPDASITNITVGMNLIANQLVAEKITTPSLFATSANCSSLNVYNTTTNRITIDDSALCKGTFDINMLNVTLRTTTKLLTITENITTPYFNTANNEMYINTTLNMNANIEVGPHSVNARDIECLNLRITGKVKEKGHDLIPTGSIIMWSGTTAPNGWALCDGASHLVDGVYVPTPDLRGRFILAYNPFLPPSNISSTARMEPNSIGTIGGKYEHTLSVEEMPVHNHNALSSGVHSHAQQGFEDVSFWDGVIPGNKRVVRSRNTNGHPIDTNDRTVKDDGNHTHVIENTGNSLPHPNIPPYYVLAYIMKI